VGEPLEDMLTICPTAAEIPEELSGELKNVFPGKKNIFEKI